jgi:hypothetical protein
VSGLASKPLGRFLIGLGLKTTRTVFTGLASKLVAMVFFSLASKLVSIVSGGLALKPAATIFSGLTSKPVMTVFSSLASKLVVTASPGLASKPTASFMVEPQNQSGEGFLGLGLKTGSSGLVIWASESLRWFLGLGLKTKWALVCWLRHKTNGGRSARDMRRDLAACFTWKQVWLGFPSLARRMAEERQRVVHVTHHGGCVGGKLKTDGLMRRAVPDPATLTLSFSMY